MGIADNNLHFHLDIFAANVNCFIAETEFPIKRKKNEEKKDATTRGKSLQANSSATNQLIHFDRCVR